MPQLSDEELFASPVSTLTASDENEEKVEVIGIRFRSAGKVYYFDPRGQKLKKGEFAIVETARGPEFGEVSLENTMVNVSETVTPLRPLIRIATPADIEHNAENREKEKDALLVCQQKIAAHKLDMKLIDVQYAFDNSKLLFYFSSDGRVDFRELVKDLASVFRTRIELRQIGIRDEAKMLGGIGSCGRILCCSTFLPDFAQVSIKMAKEQGLSLNSAKISGMCGRLMCCLHFESETYAEEIRRTPAIDSQVKTEDGIGTVISTNPLAGTIRVIFKDSPDTPPKQYHRSEVTPLGKAPKNAEKQEEKED
ncbi:MAG: stage 0 sporulation family protein [Clostridia bacterium]|nr:stage 0 sporulation family protein [Clostridia bacterium]